MAFLRADHPEEAASMQFLAMIKKNFNQAAIKFKIACEGPITAIHPKKAGKYCAFLMFKGDARSPLAKYLRQLLMTIRAWKTPKNLAWSIDIDPTEM